MLSDLLRWRRSGDTQPAGEAARGKGDEPVLPTKALPKFLSAIGQRGDSPILLDFGPVIGSNVAYFGEHLGCKLFIEDLFADYDRHAKAGTLSELPALFEKRFRHADGSVAGILCWDFFDFLDKTAAQALARQIVRMLAPGGAVMGFFTTAAAEQASFTKFEVVDDKSLRHRPHPGAGGKKHVLLNRDVIKAFEGLVVSDSFLLKTNTREILLRRKA
jgi:hypothetical protein